MNLEKGKSYILLENNKDIVSLKLVFRVESVKFQGYRMNLRARTMVNVFFPSHNKMDIVGFIGHSSFDKSNYAIYGEGERDEEEVWQYLESLVLQFMAPELLDREAQDYRIIVRAWKTYICRGDSCFMVFSEVKDGCQITKESILQLPLEGKITKESLSYEELLGELGKIVMKITYELDNG